MKGIPEDYLKMSVLNALLVLKEYKAAYPEKTTGELIQIIKSVGSYKSSYDYSLAQECASYLDWNSIVDLKSIIADILIRTNPSWMHIIPSGRELVASSLIDNERYDILQCLQSAELFMKEPDSEVVKWWDQLSSRMRSLGNDLRVESGRAGEVLTMEYEKVRLIGENISPQWVAIENNLAGYDVLSYAIDSSGIRHRKLIEVKSCNSRPIAMYISRNEWNSAVSFGCNYVFHIWYLPEKQLLELTISDVLESIPVEQGTGQWQSVYINVDHIFATQFDQD